ncbi:polyphosphate polymerase domain-containing protein [Bacillus sp. JJ722]|uniref:polyphosphate polymerase domain-containing protein n=1 Tax=Bacillus sp. JJ722 TaxID=3122973 RepID=UPI002FFF7EBC
MKRKTTFNVSRKELKYLINASQYGFISNVFDGVLIPDKNNGAFGYKIRSLYFDTPFNKDFYERIDGIENRKKIRLRTYDVNSPKVKLEIKRKIGISQKKDSLVMHRDDAQRLIECDYEVLLKYDNKIASIIYNIMKIDHYRPVVLIEYRRKAFIHTTNNIRITLDSDICSNELQLDFFNKDAVLYPLFDYDTKVLEVKYNKFLYRWISDILASCDVKQQSVSKYSLSRSFFENYML